MCESIVDGLENGSISTDAIISSLCSTESAFELSIKELIGDEKISLVKDFVPYFLNIVREQLSLLLNQKQLESCSPQRRSHNKSTSNKHSAQKDKSSRRKLTSQKLFHGSTSGVPSISGTKHINPHQRNVDISPIPVKSVTKNVSISSNSSFGDSTNTYNLSDNQDFPSMESLPSVGRIQLPKRRITPTLISKPIVGNWNDPSSSSTPNKSFEFGSNNNSSIASANTSILSIEDSPGDTYNSSSIPSNLLAKFENKFSSSNINDSIIDEVSFTSKSDLSIHEESSKRELCVDNVTYKHLLDSYVTIYSTILNENLVSNIMLEICLLSGVLQSLKSDRVYNLTHKPFINKANCIYFAVNALRYQLKSLRCLNEETRKLLIAAMKLTPFVEESFEEKLMALSTVTLTTELNSSCLLSPGTGVPFQEDSGRRKIFASDHHFHFFARQRDTFYEMIREFEDSRYKADWEFDSAFSKRISGLIRTDKFVSNLYHLANLFVDQLLETNYHSALGLAGSQSDVLGGLNSKIRGTVSLSKFQKLQERFRVPSSSEYMHTKPRFTAGQEFFKQFLEVADSYAFNMHLIKNLWNRIEELNHVEIPIDTPDEEQSLSETISEEISDKFKTCCFQLCVLGRFLGFVSFLPFQYETEAKSQLTSLTTHQDHNGSVVKNYINNAVSNERLILTVPWVVEYLARIDSETCQNKTYKECFSLLIHIYRITKLNNCPLNCTTNHFLISMMIGWLLELPISKQFSIYDTTSLDNGKNRNIISNTGLDTTPLVDHQLLYICCTYLSHIKTLLITINPANPAQSSSTYRKIKPITNDQITSASTTTDSLRLQMIDNFVRYKPKYVKRSIDFVTDRLTENLKHYIVNDLLTNEVKEAANDLIEHMRELPQNEYISLEFQSAPLLRSKISNVSVTLHSKVEETLEMYTSEHSMSLLTSLLPIGIHIKVSCTAAKIVNHYVSQKIKDFATVHLPDLVSQEISGHYRKSLRLISQERKHLDVPSNST